MTAAIKTRNATKVNTESGIDTFSQISLISMATVSGLIGLWATASVVGALLTNGPAALISGFIAALVG
ncbi:MAG: hypothetical protein KJ950_16985 [Proteobacteria bacterium]|nr:hypothetical protein [Pseudomonadota bacterium]MBU1688178.1 hypothetical protein [Pseudomonadota bacterium]